MNNSHDQSTQRKGDNFMTITNADLKKNYPVSYSMPHRKYAKPRTTHADDQIYLFSFRNNRPRRAGADSLLYLLMFI